MPLTEAEFAEGLYTAGIPDPEVVIRTSGEMRLSNYLLWQVAYSEFVPPMCSGPISIATSFCAACWSSNPEIGASGR